MKSKCTAKPYPSTTKILQIEIILALARLTFNHGIIANSIMLIAFNVLEYFVTNVFTCAM